MENAVVAPPFRMKPALKPIRKPPAKRFYEPQSDETFAQIRKRLHRMTLNSEYKKGLDKYHATVSTYPQDPEVLKPRVSSFPARTPIEGQRYNESLSPYVKPRPKSRFSFMSEENDYRNVRRRLGSNKSRYSESDLTHINIPPPPVTVITPVRNPDLFTSQIRLKDKPANTAARNDASSTKSSASDGSSGRVHLGLIESLDLNERLNDLEKIKERYSSDQFIHSLSLYKLRGHDKCYHPGEEVVPSVHVPRGTKLQYPEEWTGTATPSSLDSFKGSSMSLPPMFKDPLPFRTTTSETPYGKPGRPVAERERPWRRAPKGKSEVKKRKVEFDPTPREAEGPPPSSMSSREPKSILKKKDGTPDKSSSPRPYGKQNTQSQDSNDDEFLVTADYNWKFQLPRINSPPPKAFRSHLPPAFRKKMYHFGDGVSHEFERVIDLYGNCRQASMVREQSTTR